MIPLNRRFGPLSFYREALAIALPVMAQIFIMSIVSLIDNFMVAGLGDISMAAVNVTNHLTFVYIIIINTVCQAGGIYIAQFNGANDSEGMKNAYRFKVILGIIVAAFAMVLCRVIPGPMLAMMTTGNSAQKEIVSIGSGYFTLISWTYLPLAVSSAIGTSFREIARPKVPLCISAIATFINTAGNWILIYGNLGAPRLEVKGAAYATIIARVFELVAFVWYASRIKIPFYVHFFGVLNVKWKFIKEILVKSGMIFASEMSWISSETIMVAMYNRRGGAEVVAGMAAGWSVADIFFLIFGGIWTAAGVLVGGALGANKLDEARRRAEWLKSGSVVAGAAVSLLGALLSSLFIPLVFFNLSDSARATSLYLVLVILAYLPLWGLLNVQFAISRAGGDAATGMIADVSVNTLLFVPGAFLLSYLTDISPVRMFAILKTTDIIKYIICWQRLKKERWVRNLTG